MLLINIINILITYIYNYKIMCYFAMIFIKYYLFIYYLLLVSYYSYLLF